MSVTVGSVLVVGPNICLPLVSHGE